MRRALLPLLILAPALPALAGANPRWPARVQLADGKVEIGWETCPPGSEEWEAFLSLDGGRTYPVRVTPHLSAEIRSFSWPIPRLVADDARFLVRFGDGKTEREFDVDGRWRLLPGRDSRPLQPAGRDVARRPEPGEAHAAVWVESDGAGFRTVAPAAPPGARSSSELRPQGFSRSALPSRRTLLPQDSSRPATVRAAPRRRGLRPATLAAPSLSGLSRLNL